MGDFAGKLILAVIAFLLGLLADVIKKAFGRERRRITYSISKQPIISVNQSLPNEVLGKLPTDQTLNVIQYHIASENTGTQSVKDINLLVSANKEADLIHQEVTTIPPREVQYPSIELPAPNEVRFKGIGLERKQSIIINLFFRSRTDSNMQVFWSGGDNVEWSLSGATEEFSLEEHLVAIIRNYILAEFMPALFLGIAYLVAFLASFSAPFRNSSVAITGGIGLGQTLGSLLRFYFYLRIVPHAVAVVRDVIQRRASTARP